MSAWLALLLLVADPAAKPQLRSELIFPLHPQHNHAPGIVELPSGELFVTWYRGSGERSADDVAIYGARLKLGAKTWSEAILLADTPGFPDCNTCVTVDGKKRLWLFYPTILANSWESCLTNFKMATDYNGEGAPIWQREGLILLKPDDFGPEAQKKLDELLAPLQAVLSDRQRASFAAARQKLGEKLYQRLGWQPRCKPTILPSGRMLLPLYSDTFSISIMAITDDGGMTWQASKPLLGFGNIQPSVLRRTDGTLVAYMRENGPRKRVRVCHSQAVVL
jgi:BNR repeat protein